MYVNRLQPSDVHIAHPSCQNDLLVQQNTLQLNIFVYHFRYRGQVKIREGQIQIL